MLQIRHWITRAGPFREEIRDSDLRNKNYHLFPTIEKGKRNGTGERRGYNSCQNGEKMKQEAGKAGENPIVCLGA